LAHCPAEFGGGDSGIATVERIELASAGDRGIRSAGVDLGDTDRFELAVTRSGGEILHRVFDDGERQAVEGCSEGITDITRFTALFSMKESVVKVLGGLPRGSRYRDISLGGEPEAPVRPVRLHGALARWADDRAVEVVAGNRLLADRLVLSWALALTEGDAR
jgi:holo-[acyl-carrier protein] synthase